MDDIDAVREVVLDTHHETLLAVLACAETVASECERAAGGRAGRALAEKLERELRSEGVLKAFPALLADAAATVGYELQATPVAAPPYVAVTSVGPVARATLDDRRLVIAIEVFAVERSEAGEQGETSERGERARYVRRARSPEDALDVTFRE